MKKARILSVKLFLMNILLSLVFSPIRAVLFMILVLAFCLVALAKQLILWLINSLTREPLTTLLLDSWDEELECEQDNHDSSPESGNLLTSQEMILRNTSSPFQRRNRLKS